MLRVEKKNAYNASAPKRWFLKSLRGVTLNQFYALVDYEKTRKSVYVYDEKIGKVRHAEKSDSLIPWPVVFLLTQ